MKKKLSWSVALLSLGLLATVGTALAADEDEAKPTIAKDAVQINAFTFNVYHKSFDMWSWVPHMEFRVNGPIASGSQLYAEFTLPGTGLVKFDCKTGEIQKGRRWKTECGGRDIPEDKGSIGTGAVPFKIKMRNELAGSDMTLFTGTMKVLKTHSNEHGPKFVNHFVYYVDKDWNLPIAYVYLTPGSVDEMKRPHFNAAFWVRGDAVNFQPHLFYQGKEVGKIFYGNDEAGRASCQTEVQSTTTNFVEDTLPQKAKWSRVVCTFPNVNAWNKTGRPPTTLPHQTGAAHLLIENPGEYEFKVLWKNHLARSIKFTVDSDGRFDNGVAKANHLGTNRVIVPVQIIGDEDGQWNHNAWKTDAFYGNPLTGFTPIP